MAKEYKVFPVQTGLSGADALNKFLATNTEWKLWNVVGTHAADMALFVVERDAKATPTPPTPTGGTEAALLTESTNVVQFKKAA